MMSTQIVLIVSHDQYFSNLEFPSRGSVFVQK